jgi:autotransporter-associated beta strand protein
MLATLASLVVAGSQTGSAADFDFYISAPAVQSSYVQGTGGSSTETFNTLSAGSIGASGSWSIGSYTTLSGSPTIANADAYGGADNTRFVTLPNGSFGKVQIDLASPSRYVGFWWSAINRPNFVDIYTGNRLLASYTGQGMLSFFQSGSTSTAISGSTYLNSDYYGNPNPGQSFVNEPFAYVHVMSGTTFDRIVLSGTAFESDNWTTSVNAIAPETSLVAAGSSSIAYVWGAGVGDWNTAGNWIDNAVPTIGNDALVDNGGTPTLSGPGVSGSAAVLTVGLANAGSLAVANGGSLTATTVILGSRAGSTGTLNVGSLGGSDTAGTLNVGSLVFGSGSSVLNFNQTDGVTFGGIISGNGQLNQLGTGTTTITATSNFTGGTRIAAGTLVIADGGSLGTAPIVDDSALVVSRTSSSLGIYSVISGSGSLTQDGTTLISIWGTNSYSGGTVINRGTIQAVSQANIGTGPITFGGTTGQFISTGSASVYTNDIVVAGTAGTVSFRTANNSVTTLNGTISGGTPDTVFGLYGGEAGQNTGRIIVNGTNTIQGTILVDRGPVVLGNSLAAGTATIRLNSNSPADGALQFGSSFEIANPINITSVNAVEKVGVATSQTNGITGLVYGTKGIDKVGDGTLVLSGSNTYAGATNVSAGTLLINGNQSSGTGGVSVAAGATLGGTGRTGGTVSVASGGTLTAGSVGTIGSFTTSSVTLLDGSTFSFDVNSAAAPGPASADLLTVIGPLSLAGMTSLSLTNLDTFLTPFPQGTTLTLMSYTSGSWNGGLFSFGGTTLANNAEFSAGGTLWRIVYDDMVGGVNVPGGQTTGGFLNVVAVPEPAGWLLAVIGALFGAIGWRRNARRPAGYQASPDVVMGHELVRQYGRRFTTHL